MKILHITLWFPSEHQPVNGNFVESHIRAAARIGADHSVIFLNVYQSTSFLNIRLVQKRLAGNIALYSIEMGSRFWKLLFNIPLIHWFAVHFLLKRQLGRDYRPDIVHSHVVYPAGILGHRVAKYFNAPHVITEHWTEVKDFLQKNIYGAKGHVAYQNASRILPVSKYLKDVIVSGGVNPGLIEVVPNVVDSDCFVFKEKSPFDKNRRLRFIAVMAMRKTKLPHKRPDIAIEALEQFAIDSGISVSLEIIGGGDLLDEYRAKYKDCLIELILSGNQTREYVASALQQSDFFIHPTMKETFSIVVAEALKTGTPVITSNVGAIPELIDADSGVLCENTIEDWVMAITAASKYRFDHALIAEKNKNKFNAKDIGNQLYCTYQSIIGSA